MDLLNFQSYHTHGTLPPCGPTCRHRTLLCWLSGWLNLLGQVSFTAGLEYVLARLVATVVFLHTGGAEQGGLMLGNGQLLAVVAGMLAVGDVCISGVWVKGPGAGGWAAAGGGGGLLAVGGACISGVWGRGPVAGGWA